MGSEQRLQDPFQFRTETTTYTPTVLAYAPESVLTIEQVADWLQVGKTMVEKLDIPFVLLGTRTKRYLGKAVLEYLEKRSAA